MSKRLRRIAFIASALGLVAGLAVAAAPKKRNKPSSRRDTSRFDCGPKPDKNKCLATASDPTRTRGQRPGRTSSYLDQCGKKWGEYCRQFVNDGLEEHYNDNPSPQVKMFKPKRDDIPSGLRMGKTNEYQGPNSKSDLLGTFSKPRLTKVKAKSTKSTLKKIPKSARRPSTKGKKANKLAKTRVAKANLAKKRTFKSVTLRTSDNIFSRTGLTRPPYSGLGNLPVNAHRSPGWDANGQQVKSCEEYAYEQVYDWARYTDAVAACAGDHICQMDVAFLPSTPGIARRQLKRKDGTPLKTQIKYRKKYTFPKNDFFAGGKKFARAAGNDPLPPTPDLLALEAALAKGEQYYSLGGPGRASGDRNYADEWDFHQKMHDKNRTVSEAEFEEYEKRKRRMRELLQQWAWAAKKEEAEMTGKARASVQRWVAPIDMVSSNPFERMNRLRSHTRKMTKSASRLQRAGKLKRGGAAVTPKATPGATPKASPSANPVNRGKSGPRSVPNKRPSVGPASPGTAKPGKSRKMPTPVGMLEDNWGPMAPVTVLASFAPKKPKPSSSKSSGKASKTKHQASMCFPTKFTKGISEMLGRGPISCQIGQLLRSEWERKKRGEKTCLDLDNDDCDWSPLMFEQRFVEGVPYLKEQNTHETYCLDYTADKINRPNLTASKKYIDDRKKAISEELKKLRPYQTKPTSAKSFGMGWSDAEQFGDKAWFAAGYDYDLGWDIEAWESEGNDVCQLGAGARGGFGVDGWFINNNFEIVDGLARIDYNRQRHAKKKDVDGDYDVHLRVFRKNVFDPLKGDFSGSFEDNLFEGTVQIPTGYKPSFNIMAGPVPITGAVWGEFFYGADFALDTFSEAKNCDMSHLKFGVDADFVPQVGLNGKAQVGVGISGLLSAGIRGLINLVTVGVPVTAEFDTTFKNLDGVKEATLNFGLDVQLALSTLSGWIAVYVELLFFEEEFVLFRWNGLGPYTISLLGKPLGAELPLFVMTK